MKSTLFDSHNQRSLTIELDGPSFDQRIVGKGYFIVILPGSKYVAFSKRRIGICFGDVSENVIPNYTRQQYATEYGDRLTGMGMTVKKCMQTKFGMREIK